MAELALPFVAIGIHERVLNQIKLQTEAK